MPHSTLAFGVEWGTISPAPACCGTGGVMGHRPTQGDEKRPLSSNRSPWQLGPPLCHPERARISYFTALASATNVVLLKENHMGVDRSRNSRQEIREAEGSAVPRTPPGNVFDQSVAEWRDLGVPLNDSLPLAWATGKTLIYPTWKQSLPGWLLTSTRHAANLRRTRDMSSEARDHRSDPD